VHNSIPKYASTTSISTVMIIPFHLKQIFEEVIFSSNIIKTPRRWSIEKKRENLLKKEKRKKRGRKRKAPKVSSNKREVNILRGEKHFNFKIFFLM
jgi:hypothetical protein